MTGRTRFAGLLKRLAISGVRFSRCGHSPNLLLTCVNRDRLDQSPERDGQPEAAVGIFGECRARGAGFLLLSLVHIVKHSPST